MRRTPFQNAAWKREYRTPYALPRPLCRSSVPSVAHALVGSGVKYSALEIIGAEGCGGQSGGIFEIGLGIVGPSVANKSRGGYGRGRDNRRGAYDFCLGRFEDAVETGERETFHQRGTITGAQSVGMLPENRHGSSGDHDV